jgi:hypothetical protein
MATTEGEGFYRPGSQTTGRGAIREPPQKYYQLNLELVVLPEELLEFYSGFVPFLRVFALA